MSRAQRFALVGLAAVVAAVAFVVLRPAGEEAPGPARPGEGRPSSGAGGGRQGEEQGPGRRPRYAEVRVERGRPVGGAETIRARKGETVRLSVRSDTPEEVHVHGYDLTGKVAAGRPVRFSFAAELEGAFEIELERTHEQVATLKVEP